MLSVSSVANNQLSIIQRLAYQTWPQTFGNILSEAQIAYMLDGMYSLSSLQEQVEQKGHHFLLIKDEQDYLGFAAFELHYQQLSKTKIHKIYILPSAQGKGVGKTLMATIAEKALAAGNAALSLNVNRFNPAVKFYQKIGFAIIKEEDIDIGKGFLMEDYVMEKQLFKKV